MAKSFDIQLVRFLFVSALSSALVVSFWLIFERIKSHQQINSQIEDYLQKELILSAEEPPLEETMDALLDKRLEAMQWLLTELLYLVAVLFGFATTLLRNSSLSLCFAIFSTTALIVNLFVPVLTPEPILLLAITLCVLSWLYFDISGHQTDNGSRHHTRDQIRGKS